MSRICVFAGARPGNDQRYMRAANDLGKAIAARGFSLVYGGAKVGLMGRVAQSALEGGAEVVGVIPEFLAHEEVLQPGLSKTVIVEDLFQRKAKMIELSTSFIALPGGIGTLDELLEIITWRQLKQLDGAIGVLNIAGYFEPWFEALRHAIECGFMDSHHLENIIRCDDAVELLNSLHATGPAPA